MSSKALTERSPNTCSPTKSQTTKLESTQPTVSRMEDTHATAERTSSSHTQETCQTASYHSPSDNILSPTSKKLSEIKGKRFASGKPQSLFAKTVQREGMKSQGKLFGSSTTTGEQE